ncbi:spore coat protein CotJB [Peptococcaceae bacterium 1198_IL3148]
MSNQTLDRRCMRLLQELMEWGFVRYELQLFLDTHPRDRRAFEEYCRAARRVHELTMEYERYCGPLMLHGHCPEGYPWQWIETPWPWEIEY